MTATRMTTQDENLPVKAQLMVGCALVVVQRQKMFVLRSVAMDLEQVLRPAMMESKMMIGVEKMIDEQFYQDGADLEEEPHLKIHALKSVEILSSQELKHETMETQIFMMDEIASVKLKQDGTDLKTQE